MVVGYRANAATYAVIQGLGMVKSTNMVLFCTPIARYKLPCVRIQVRAYTRSGPNAATPA